MCQMTQVTEGLQRQWTVPCIESLGGVFLNTTNPYLFWKVITTVLERLLNLLNKERDHDFGKEDKNVGRVWHSLHVPLTIREVDIL